MAKKAETPPQTVPGYRYHSPNVPLSAIRRYAKRIASKFDPDKIILFGSYAYGQPHEWSDVDLLVVMPAYDETNQAIRIINTLEAPFSLDLIVGNPETIERDWQDGDWFLREVLAKGKIIHEKADRPVGSQGRGRLGQQSLAQGKPSLNDLICFHCQQSAEKYLKAPRARIRHNAAAHAQFDGSLDDTPVES